MTVNDPKANFAGASFPACRQRLPRPARDLGSIACYPALMQHCRVHGIRRSQARPELRILWRLNSNPKIPIMRHRHQLDVVTEIVQYQVGILHTYDEKQMMFAGRCYDLRQQQRSRRPTALLELMPLGDCVVLAVTGRRRDPPLFGRSVAGGNRRNDVSVHLAVDNIEFVPAFRR